MVKIIEFCADSPHTDSPKLSNISYTGHSHSGQADGDLSASAEREGLAGHVGVGQRLHQLSGARALQVQLRVASGDVYMNPYTDSVNRYYTHINTIHKFTPYL